MNLRASIAVAAVLTGSSLAAAFPGAVGLSGAQAAETKAAPGATVSLIGPDGASRGSVALTASPRGGVVLRVEAQGLPAGWHGLHFHAKGDCSDPKFEKAGGHTHGGEKSVHGLLNASATDTGDLPNLYVGEDGTGMAEVYSGLVRLSGGTPAQNLLDADGSAVLIHANPDDHTSQPIGGAGPRIACGVIKPAR